MVFQQLQYFVTVAETQSINRAAEELYISQQSLRASINSLEQKLGFRLFSRSSKGMRLTEQGRIVLDDAKRILEIAAGWDQLAKPSVSEPETVRVLASTLVCNAVLTDLVLECRKRYPNLRISFSDTREDELMHEMGPHTIGVLGSVPDEVIRNRLTPYAQEHQYVLKTFGMDRFCVYLNQKNPLAQQPYLTTAQLNNLVLSIYPQEDQRFYYRRIYQHFSSMHPFFIEKQEAIFRMISEMPDVASIFPHLAIVNNMYIQRNQVVAMAVKNFPMPATSCMLLPPQEIITPGERMVSELIQKRLQSLAEELNRHPAGNS
jgi:DNA-binding transcriptional LysR family regulator